MKAMVYQVVGRPYADQAPPGQSDRPQYPSALSSFRILFVFKSFENFELVESSSLD